MRLFRFRSRLNRTGFRIFSYLIQVLFFATIFSCVSEKQMTSSKPDALDKVLSSGELTVITENTADCYYLYQDNPMGFEYDLAKAFADSLGVRLKVEIVDTWEEMISDLRSGKGDLIAAGLTASAGLQDHLAFSIGYLPVQQHIIVHRNNGGISRPEDLQGKQVHVRKGTPYEERLEDLRRQGIDVITVPVEDLPAEELIRQVAEGDIETTIANSNVALLNRRYYPQAIVAGPVYVEDQLRWAVNSDSQKLLTRINQFFRAYRRNGKIEEIYDRYFAHVELFDYLDVKAFHDRLRTRLPRFIALIQKAAAASDFDWRLIAAQIYQESCFDSDVISPIGMIGLMQISPLTAERLGVSNPTSPAENIRAGVRYLKEIYDTFDKAYGQDRILISLAAYNVGMGHVLDARNIARQQGLDPNKWSSIEKTLPLLSRYSHYKKTRFGYARGAEPVAYVKQILIYYDILKRQEISCRGGESQEIPARDQRAAG